MKTALLLSIILASLLVSQAYAQGCSRGGGMQSPGMGSMMSPLNTSPATAALQQAQMAYQYQAQLAYQQQQAQLQQAYLQQQENMLTAKKQENRERRLAERRERKESEKARRLAAKVNALQEKSTTQPKSARPQETAAAKFASVK
ncbi:MAG TPA: hypothetical protein VGN12_17875 [Pirellulales bacterium]|jgi:hypothetical protein